ncbi:MULTISPECIES: 2-dehydro-3-deoxygalactonokinase [unclassified Chelatococcus]|uniref:2-dehydro-3-deoxygalactonokinase n=1 Tax=unclassified Chelatococcus TaxID=2638111 RepID=UPI001BCBE006|nr:MULTISPECIES: 2-dehydro-3-deoxygalactonokinase [unclassified Chelatococcus]MBS7699279.1 2-dehydro-3-deoxygalactonokinase [Chelatococcus sp. YT9]MBX3557589.1 2-dehydro-3-deoxygalactonokinase [Chelatococcus sp.]
MQGNQESEARQPVLVALDWGTSSLRGFLMDKDADVIDQRSSSRGIQNLPEPGVPGFEKAFAALCGEWLVRWPDLPVVAGGMVGSAQGWVEAPYVACPADVAELARYAGRATTADGSTILIAPGVIDNPADGPPDVMRGEEIQIAGALADHPLLAERASIIMPGTHSKWVAVVASRITRFHTYMTGEVFAVMAKHSILGRLMTAPEEGAAPAAAETAFLQGVKAARDSHAGDLLNQLFSVRSLGLTKRLPGDVLKDYLSGLLIGQELSSGLARLKAAAGDLPPVVLIGDDGLCNSYRRAMALFDITPVALLGNTAPAGLFRFATATGMLDRA